jgi:cytochrome c553
MSKKVIVPFLALAAAAGGVLFLAGRGMMGGASQAQGGPGTAAQAADARERLVQRGAYLMAIMACNDCHSAHTAVGLVPGMELAGHPETAPAAEWDPSLMDRNILVTISPTLTSFAGPFGTVYAANLTPDKETGIGNMTAEQLIASWRTGKHWREDRPVMPPMPIEAYAAVSDDDIRALHAFLMSRPPVKNRVPAVKINLPAGN